MALDNYVDLQASVVATLNKPELAQQVPDFIAMAEAALNRILRVRKMVAQAALSIAAEYTALPADFAEERSLVLGTDPPLDLRWETVDTLDQIARSQALAFVSTPRRVAVVGTKLRVRPVPDTAYAATLTYYQKLPSLAANATNWLLADYPDVYLYGALVHSAPALGDDARMQLWLNTFERIIGGIQHSERERVGKRLRTDPALQSWRYRNGVYNIANDQF